jgi:hypothetical protein
MDKKISELTQLTARTESDVIAIVNGGSTKKISVEDFIREPVINAGNVSGALSVDLSLGHWFIFTLTGNVSVTLSNEKEGEEFVFWIYSNGNYSVNSMTLTSGGNIYCQSGSLPNPANNKWNFYRGFVLNGGLVLTELDNFSAI